MEIGVMFSALVKPHASVVEPAAPPAAVPVRDQQQKLAMAFRQVVPGAYMSRFAVLNLIGAALIAAAWAEGLLMKPFEADSSGMCYGIAALFAWGLYCVARRDWQSVR